MKIHTLLYCALALVIHGLPLSSPAQTATINAGTVYQTIDGFGGENGGPWSWASTPYNWNNVDSTTAANMFSPTSGIGISIYRADSVDGTSSTTLPDLQSIQSAVALGAVVELSMQSPPSSMKYSGLYFDGTINPSTGTSCLSSSASYSTYAAYIVGVIQNLAASGVTVTYLDVANEPNAPSTGSGGNGFGTCGWSEGGLDAFVKVLGPALLAAGLSPKVMIASVFPYSNAPSYFGTCLADSGCNQYVSIYSGHGYGYPGYPVAPGSGGYPALSTGKHMWLSETGDQGSWDPNMDSGLTLAQNIQVFLQVGQVSSYNWWELGQINNGGSCTDCNLIGTNSDGSNTYTKRFYVFGNYSKFVRPGQVEIAATQNPQSGVTVTAFENTSTGAFEIVAVNSNNGSVSQPFSLSGLSATSVTPYVTDPNNNLVPQSPLTITSNAFTTTLTGSSVTTFVAVGSSGPGAPKNLSGTVIQ
jgi:glucuronoarabinoxylan endo-1,4-beta-xylanase